MACYAGGETASHPTQGSWEAYDYILATRPLVEILQVIDDKRDVMGLSPTVWPYIGSSPSITALDTYNWDASATPPLQVIFDLMGSARSTLSSLISATMVDADCKRWRWSNTSGITAALPSTTLRNEKETWLAWHTAMRAALALMIQTVSDAWTQISVPVTIELLESEVSGTRYMQEAGAFGDDIYSLRASRAYNNFGDCSGSSFSTSDTINLGGFDSGIFEVFGVAKEIDLDLRYLAQCDLGAGSAFPAVAAGGSESASAGFEYESDVDELFSGVDVNRSGYRVKADGGSPTGYYTDAFTPFTFDAPIDIAAQGWWIADYCRKKYRITFISVPGGGPFSIDWNVISNSTGNTAYQNVLFGSRGSRSETPHTIIQPSSSFVIPSSPGTVDIEFECELDDSEGFPIGDGEYPNDYGDAAYSTRFRPDIPLLSGGNIVFCVDACGNLRAPT